VISAEPDEFAPALPASITIQRRLEWIDTDASGAHHNTAAIRLMEAAELALIDRLGFLDDVYGLHPRTRIEAEFLRPLFFRDLVEVALRVAGVDRASVEYEAEISRGGVACVRGRIVAVRMDASGAAPEPWPDEQRRLFESAGPQRPERLRDGDAP